MKLDEAITECKHWLAHLERQKVKTERMQELAAMARKGPEQHAEAKRQLRMLDGQAPTVYDGAKLQKAVICLLAKIEGDLE